MKSTSLESTQSTVFGSCYSRICDAIKGAGIHVTSLFSIQYIGKSTGVIVKYYQMVSPNCSPLSTQLNDPKAKEREIIDSTLSTENDEGRT